jgi:GxxExxY protein
MKALDDLNIISGRTIECAMQVHSALGPGLLESSYEACLTYELRNIGYAVSPQCPVPLHYKGVCLDVGYRIDLLIEDSVVVELKAIDKLLPIHDAQLLSYLKLSGKRVGLLINFHVLHLKDGIKRMING